MWMTCEWSVWLECEWIVTGKIKSVLTNHNWSSFKPRVTCWGSQDKQGIKFREGTFPLWDRQGRVPPWIWSPPRFWLPFFTQLDPDLTWVRWATWAFWSHPTMHLWSPCVPRSSNIDMLYGTMLIIPPQGRFLLYSGSWDWPDPFTWRFFTMQKRPGSMSSLRTIKGPE